jgi:hypothetical protein
MDNSSSFSGHAAAAPPAARPAPPRPRSNGQSPPSQQPVEEIGQIEEIEEISEIEEVAPAGKPAAAPARPASRPAAQAAKEPDAKKPAAKEPAAETEPEAEPEGGDDDPSPRFRFRNWLRQSGAMFISTTVHAVAIIVLALLVIEPKAVVKIQEVIAESLIEPEKQEELKVELENQLTEVREQTTQVFSSSPVVGEVGASGPSGLVSAPTIDKALLEQVVNANVNVEGIFIDVPSSKKLIVQAPDGQVGDARAVVVS